MEQKGTLIQPAKPIICLALTAYRTIEQKTVQSLFNTMGTLPYRFTFISHTSANVWKGRNHIVEHFLEGDADYLMFVDADMIFGPAEMDTLIKSAIENSDIGLVGGFYVSRDTDIRPLMGWTDDKGFQLSADDSIAQLLASRGKLVECDLIPTGFMLIRREVLEAIPNPWFIVETKIKEGGEICHFSSDNVFVCKVKEAGFKTYGHFGVELGHIGTFVYHPAQMWPQLEAWNSMTALNNAKLSYGKEYGFNTKKYWDSLYSTEKELNRERVYPILHKAIVSGIQDHWAVLDVGSGPGVLASEIAKVAYATMCLDLSETAIGYCKEKGLDAVQWDMVNDPVPTNLHGRYDCVVCTEVLEHLDSPEAAIKKLYSFLKKEGMIMISVPDDRLPPEEEPEHVRTFTAAKLAKLMLPFEEVFVEPVDGYLLAVGKKPAKPKG